VLEICSGWAPLCVDRISSEFYFARAGASWPAEAHTAPYISVPGKCLYFVAHGLGTMQSYSAQNQITQQAPNAVILRRRRFGDHQRRRQSWLDLAKIQEVFTIGLFRNWLPLKRVVALNN